MGIPEQVELMHALHIKAGRAVLAVLFKGMIEREWTSSRVFPEPGSVRFRALMVRHATELSRGLGYLETRDDIYMGWLAYLGFSWGPLPGSCSRRSSRATSPPRPWDR